MSDTKTTLSASKNGNERDVILASIRQNLATSAPFDAVRGEHHAYSRFLSEPPPRPTITRETLIDNFRKNLESVGGHCTLVADENEAATSVAAIVKKTGSTRVAISDSKLVGRLVQSDTASEILENCTAALLFDCDIGITSAQWAIAETGTLVLESEKESHRLTSLVPPVHLCVLKASSIRQTLGEILELTREDLSRTVTFITGASRTSDIELTLAIGVHGPAELHVVVIADQ